ncbi:MAG: TIGR02710 family CRISPR-associated CARF protein [Candidatus Eremiobacterota bacterium]
MTLPVTRPATLGEEVERSMQVLLVTVGGSFRPVLTSIQMLQPDRVVFVVTGDSAAQVNGPGKPCREGETALPNLLTQLEWEGEYELCQVSPDDVSGVYREVCQRIERYRSDGHDLRADYTGGTKSMSVGLAAAAIDHEVDLYLTTGPRTNLVRVDHGELTELSFAARIRVERMLRETLPSHLQSYDYAAAGRLLKQLLLSRHLARDVREHVRWVAQWCSAFEAWDRFDHEAARKSLQPFKRYPETRRRVQEAERILQSRQHLEDGGPLKKHTSGYEVLEDLLLNAERRAVVQRYDDAVGRLYRSLELLAQLRLWMAFGLKTGDVERAKLPEAVREKFPGEEKVVLGLERSFTLLADLGDEPLGALWLERAGELKNALQVRNHSIFAHGFQPVHRGLYRDFERPVVGFLRQGLERLSKAEPLTQLPRGLDPELVP